MRDILSNVPDGLKRTLADASMLVAQIRCESLCRTNAQISGNEKVKKHLCACERFCRFYTRKKNILYADSNMLTFASCPKNSLLFSAGRSQA